ncbi:hypothetical protein [Mucilaginibacter sp.]
MSHKYLMMNKRCLLFAGFILLFFNLALFKGPTLKGTWEYKGGIYNGKASPAPSGYQLQRKYTKTTFETFLLEPDTMPQRFQISNYLLTADSCIETETFSKIPSKLTNIPVHYAYTLRQDTLTLTGMIPTGMQVKEYWVKIK